MIQTPHNRIQRILSGQDTGGSVKTVDWKIDNKRFDKYISPILEHCEYTLGNINVCARTTVCQRMLQVQFLKPSLKTYGNEKY